MPAVSLGRVAIHEDVLLPGVAVQVYEQQNFPFLLGRLDEPLQSTKDGVSVPSGLNPASVQVVAPQVAPGVPIHHAVDVDHGHDLEDVLFPQFPGSYRWTHQIVDDAFHHVTSARFPRMHSRRENYRFLLLHLFSRVEGRDSEEVGRVSCQTLAEHLPLDVLVSDGILHELVEVALQVRVSVRVAVRQVTRIVVVVEGDGESQGEVVEGALALEAVGVVADVGALSRPALVVALSVDLRVAEWFHPVVVQTVRLQQVYDVESVRLARSGICHLEIEPLRLAFGVEVWLENEVVLVLLNLDCPAQVGTFEARLKLQRVVFLALQFIPRLEMRVIVTGLWSWNRRDSALLPLGNLRLLFFLLSFGLGFLRLLRVWVD